MEKISSGIRDVDRLTDSFYVGDNVVWEVDAGTSFRIFTRNFIKQAAMDGEKIVYISFNRSPQSVIKELGEFLYPDIFLLIDCFTAGKGKNDNTFLKFYETKPKLDIIKVEHPRKIEEFTETLNSIEDRFPGSRYVFDSLTGMQDLWASEDDTYRFFTYMCPRLYDLDTVAYWTLEKDAHSQQFKANLRHITQVVLDLYKRREKLYIKALKLEGRQNREAFKPHAYEINGSEISITGEDRESLADIGTKLKEARIRAGLNQKELAGRVDLTPSSISQLESNQISPSLSSFLQICQALGVEPSLFLDNRTEEKTTWLYRKGDILSTPLPAESDIKIYDITADEKISARLAVFPPETRVKGHFIYQRREELIVVLRGNISVKVEGKEEMLHRGDCVYLKEAFPSEWINEGGDEAELLVVC